MSLQCQFLVKMCGKSIYFGSQILKCLSIGENWNIFGVPVLAENVIYRESWGMANTILLGIINATYKHDLKSLVYNHKVQVKYY